MTVNSSRLGYLLNIAVPKYFAADSILDNSLEIRRHPEMSFVQSVLQVDLWIVSDTALF